MVEVRVTGWREVRARLNNLGGQLPKAARAATKDAARLVVVDAKSRVSLGPGRGGHARSSVRSAATKSGMTVRGGGPRFEYYPFLEFGGRVGRKNSVYRKRVKRGRYIYPALNDQRAAIRRALDRNLGKAVRGSGLRTRRAG